MMPKIRMQTRIAAPVERVFDLSRSIDLHLNSQHAHGEVAVAGRISGLIGPGESVTWEARHFGIRLRHTACITQFNRPRYFQDSMTQGVFTRFVHDHIFHEVPTGTEMTDVLEFQAPFGIPGRVVDRLVLSRYLRQLLTGRNHIIRTAAETGQWRSYLHD
jgi:ligand-binding SRPBCC domain-containing protein